jgi:hypothetical protein
LFKSPEVEKSILKAAPLMGPLQTMARIVRPFLRQSALTKSIVELSGAMLLLTDRDLNVELAIREFWMVHLEVRAGARQPDRP